MSTSGNECTTRSVAADRGIDKVVVDLSAEQSKGVSDEIDASGSGNQIAGDIVSDAPAFAADVSVVMRSGANVAVESADFTLVTEQDSNVTVCSWHNARSTKSIVENRTSTSSDDSYR